MSRKASIYGQNKRKPQTINYVSLLCVFCVHKLCIYNLIKERVTHAAFRHPWRICQWSISLIFDCLGKTILPRTRYARLGRIVISLPIRICGKSMVLFHIPLYNIPWCVVFRCQNSPFCGTQSRGGGMGLSSLAGLARRNAVRPQGCAPQDDAQHAQLSASEVQCAQPPASKVRWF